MREFPIWRYVAAVLSLARFFPALRRGTAAAEREAMADAAWSGRDAEERYRSLVEALDRAESASAAKSRFLATVSHEIRTPLNGILGLAAVLQDTELTAEQQNFVRAIRTSGGLLLGLVDDMLDLARIEAGQLALEPEATDPTALVQDVVELLAARAFARGIDIAAYLAPDLPEEVKVDGARLRQVLANLVGNAIKYTERGGVSVSAAPTRTPAGTRLAFAVADSGPGMDADAVARLLAPADDFAGPVSRPDHGAGLGIPISREIVRRMGGDIEVGSRPGGGTVVSFSIPLEKASAPALRAEPLANFGRRCLIVAPDEVGAEIAARYLSEAGLAARQVTAPARAAALAAAAAAAGIGYDFLLIDARLSPAPGKMLAAIREAAGARTPAAILIEPGNRKFVPALRDAGFDAYLVRPLRRASLLKIASVLLAPGEGFGIDPGDEKKAAGRPAALAGRSLRVLVIEDNEINALLLRAVLERLGHSVVELRDGEAVLAAARPEEYDLILLDLHLAGADGVAIAKEIRARELPAGAIRPLLVAVTGDGAPAAREGAAAAGFDAFLEKPVEPEMLRQLLENLEYPSAA